MFSYQCSTAHMPNIHQVVRTPSGYTDQEDSINRRWWEKSMEWKSKHANYKQFRAEHGHKPKYCRICSEFSSARWRPEMEVVQHIHNSSKELRLDSRPDAAGNYLCTSCRHTPHSFRVGDRYPVIVTSSTLNNWQGNRSGNHYRGDEFHVEVISIPGGKIDELRVALLAEYTGSTRALDVLLVAGLNDVLRDFSVAEITNSLTRFQQAVHSLAPSGSTCSIGISTMLLPPKCADLKDRYRDHSNSRLWDMVDVNTIIMDLNSSQPQDYYPVRFAPRFHTWGLASTTTPKAAESYSTNLTGRGVMVASLLAHHSTKRSLA